MMYTTIREIVAKDTTGQPPLHIVKQEYLRRISGESTFRTGISVHNNEFFVVAFRDLIVLLDTIREQEILVEQLWLALPRIAKKSYIHELIGSEMESTNTIEGVHTTRQEIAEALASALNDTPHKRFSEFAKLFLMLAEQELNMPSSLKDIRSIYDKVIDGELTADDMPDGQLFRAKTVAVYDGGGRKLHDGAYPETTIQVLLTQWIALAQRKDIPPLLRAAMGHYIFEYIHPFYDGNGRTGRFLLALQLSEYLSVPTALSVSSVIADEKSKYLKAFDQAQHPLNSSDISVFCYRLLEFVAAAQSRIISVLQEKVRQLDFVYAQVEKNKDFQSLTKAQYNVLFFLVQYELFDSRNVKVTRRLLGEQLEMGIRKITTACRELVAHGLIIEHGSRPVWYQLNREQCGIMPENM